MKKYIDYLFFTQKGNIYFIFTCEIFMMPILGCLLGLKIFWNRVIIILLIWIIVTIFHVMIYNKNKNDRKE